MLCRKERGRFMSGVQLACGWLRLIFQCGWWCCWCWWWYAEGDGIGVMAGCEGRDLAGLYPVLRQQLHGLWGQQGDTAQHST